jgi:hypothetical protein
LSAGKPAPTVPSDQGFYQSLWGLLERSTRSLKRTSPSAITALPPPPKKAKASSSIEASSETSAPQTRHNTERRNNK